MCLASTGRIISLEPGGAVVEVDGRLRWASTSLLPDVRVGEWVLISALTILDRLDSDEEFALQDGATAMLERDGRTE
jgi:hydrogenase assembly chaperone HypC/HupF